MDKELLIKFIKQGFSTWKLAKQFKTTQPNIRYWLKKFNLQTIRKTCKIENYGTKKNRLSGFLKSYKKLVISHKI